MTEDEIYEKIMIEIEENNKHKGTWAKAFAKTDGNENKVQALYIRLRLVEITNSENKRVLNNLENKAKELLIEKENQFKIMKYKNCIQELEDFKNKYNIISVKKINDTLYLATFSNTPIDAYIELKNEEWNFQNKA
jgi:hypothetical protein